MPTAAECTRQERCIHPTRLRPNADPGPLPRLLEQDCDIGALRLGKEVDDPLRVRRDRAGRVEVRVEERGMDDPAAGGAREAVQHPAEQPQLGLGLGAVEPA